VTLSFSFLHAACELRYILLAYTSIAPEATDLCTQAFKVPIR